MLARAANVPADMVILDLEDAVAPTSKQAARHAVASAVRATDWGSRIVGVRVNGWTSPWTVTDVLTVVANSGDRLDVVVLPKVDDPGMLRALDLVLAQAERDAGRPSGSIGIDAQIETAAGVQHLPAICAASDRLHAIALGSLDLTFSLGMPPTADPARRRFDTIASAMVVAGRVVGIQVIDGPYVDVRDLDGLRGDAQWAAHAGFDGKWVVHPDQVPIVNDVFSPSEADLITSERVLSAYRSALDDSARGAVVLDGVMIDEASARIARRVVQRGNLVIRDVP